MSTIVLTFFTTSDAYKADSSVINEGMALISSCDGVLGNYHGISKEDNNVGVTIEIATSGEAFKAIVTNQELFDKILNQMLVSRVGDIEQYHANMISDPKPCLSGSLTEVCLLSLKDPTPENKQALETIAKSIKKTVGEKWTYGWCVEDSNKVIAVAAWDSVEAKKARAQEPEVVEIMKKLLPLIDTNGGPFHFNLARV